MIFLPFIILPLLIAPVFFDSLTATWLCLASMVALLLTQVRKGQVSGTGAFLFMSLLFFGIRPIYMITEDDYRILEWLFRVQVTVEDVNENVWWGLLGMVAFWAGSEFIRFAQRARIAHRTKRESLKRVVVTANVARALVLFQIATLPVMLFLSTAGRALYGSAFGAYAYDLPIPLQAIHIITLLVLLERYLDKRRQNDLIGLIVSGVLFLVFTWFMREVSMFRGFYVAGVMIAGISMIMRIKGRVSYAWLIVPIIVFQPFFRTLGETRFMDNDALKEAGFLEQTFSEGGLTQTYWDFYKSSGDMNILDTFIAARASDPQTKPYIMSWLYAPIHIVPRFIWQGKPERGILHDVSFMNGAPYSPGIAGFFWLDGGGDGWMIASMLALGICIGFLDGYVLSMRDGYLKCAFLGILSINAMFLTRFYLWQAFWQIMYFVVPCLILSKIFSQRTIVIDGPDDQEEDQVEDSESDTESFPGKNLLVNG